MSPRALQVVTLLVVLGSALVANPPPGALMGEEVSAVVGSSLLGLAALGGLVSILAAGRIVGWVGAALVPLPLFGPAHDIASPGFYALLAAAWAGVLHLELMTFAQRRVRWAERLEEDDEALALYERAYARSTLGLAAALAVGLVGTVAAFLGLSAIAPASFGDSIEARHVEGLFAFVAVLALIAVAVWLTMRREAPERSTIEEVSS